MKRSALYLSLVSAFLLGACGSGGSSNNASSGSGSGSSEVAEGQVEIKFLNGFTGGDGEFMKQITDGFNESQDTYHITESQEAEHYTKFKTGDFDLVIMHGSNIATYRADGMIQDVSAVMEEAGLSLDDFHPAAESIVSFDDGIYGIPLDIHPLTTFYNKQLVSEAPADYAALKELGTKLQSQDPNLYAAGVPDTGLIEFYITTIAAQNNIDLEKDGYLNFAQDEMADALMIYHDMVWKDKISPSGLGLDGEFQAFMKQVDEGSSSVQTAVAMTGPWYYQAVKEAYGDDLGIGTTPLLGETQAVTGNSHNISISSQVQDQEVLDGIAAFLKYLYTPENLLIWAESGQAPVHLDTMALIEEQQDKYPLSYQNMNQFDYFVTSPPVYQFGEQIRYMNENVFGLLVREENLTKDQLMAELENATTQAQQIAETNPNPE